jgi:hypothetical protein
MKNKAMYSKASRVYKCVSREIQTRTLAYFGGKGKCYCQEIRFANH